MITVLRWVNVPLGSGLRFLCFLVSMVWPLLGWSVLPVVALFDVDVAKDLHRSCVEYTHWTWNYWMRRWR